MTKEEIPFYSCCGYTSIMPFLILWLPHRFGICLFSFCFWILCRGDNVVRLHGTRANLSLPHTVILGGQGFMLSAWWVVWSVGPCHTFASIRPLGLHTRFLTHEGASG